MDEQQFKPAWRGFYLHFFAVAAWAAVISAKWLPTGYQDWLWRIIAAVVIYIVCNMLYKRNSLMLKVRPDKISLESGIVDRQPIEIGMRNIRSIQVKQNAMQRIFHVGDIRVTSSETDEYEINAFNVSNPHKIKERIQELQRTGPKAEEQEKAAE